MDDDKLIAIVTSELAYPALGEVCENPEHLHTTLGCMWHDYRHVVGGMCLDDDCGKQWFFAEDWSSPECRAERKTRDTQ